MHWLESLPRSCRRVGLMTNDPLRAGHGSVSMRGLSYPSRMFRGWVYYGADHSQNTCKYEAKSPLVKIHWEFGVLGGDTPGCGELKSSQDENFCLIYL